MTGAFNRFFNVMCLFQLNRLHRKQHEEKMAANRQLRTGVIWPRSGDAMKFFSIFHIL
jgi:hypothetical protein